MLETGQRAPDFSLDTDTSLFSLAEHHGKNVVVFFFPKADTSGCTNEAIAFSSLHEDPVVYVASGAIFRIKNPHIGGFCIV